MSTKDEINAMFDALERTVPTTDAPFEEAPVEKPEEKVEDAPKTAAPSTTVPKDDDEPKTKPPTTDAPVEDELTKVKKEVEELRTKLADKVVIKDVPKTKPPTTDAPLGDHDFVKDVDLDEVTREPSAFNKLLNSIYKKAVETVRGEVRKSKEETIQVLPSIISSNMELQKTLKDLSDKFYEENKDLKPFRKVVGVVFDEISSQDPKVPYTEVLRKVGEETRKRLELKKPDAKSVIKDKDDPPPLPRHKSGGRSPQPKHEPSSVISQIDEMNKTLNH